MSAETKKTTDVTETVLNQDETELEKQEEEHLKEEIDSGTVDNKDLNSTNDI